MRFDLRTTLCGRDLYGDISLPGGIALSSFTRKWAETTLALDANDLGRLPWPAKALKYVTRCNSPLVTRVSPSHACIYWLQACQHSITVLVYTMRDPCLWPILTRFSLSSSFACAQGCASRHQR